MPRALPPPALCQAAKLAARAELLAAGTAAELSRGGGERRAAERTDPGLCTLSRRRGCPAHTAAPRPKGSLCRSCARTGGFHRRCRLRWVPTAATLQVGTPRGSRSACTAAGQWVPGQAAGCASLFPGTAGQGSVLGGKGRRLQREPACGRLRPAHCLSWCSPVHPRVPRCQL